MTFSPRTAIVTGSSSGIGQATAVALAEAGFDVGITWHTGEEGAQHTAALVRQAGRKAAVAHLNTAEAPDCADVVDQLADELGGLDVFVNNAGMNKPQHFLDTDFDTWRLILASNLDGAFACMQRAAKRMVSAGSGGRIIAVTSVHQEQPKVGFSAYDASKHALGGLIRTMAIELADKDITVNAVLPGGIHVRPDSPEGPDPYKISRPGVPAGRPGHPREIADVITFLASPASSYVNGASWVVDGGMLQMGPQAGSHMTSDEWRKG